MEKCSRAMQERDEGQSSGSLLIGLTTEFSGQTPFLVRVFGCDPCGTGQQRATKLLLDIERLSRESDRQRFNLVHVSIKLQTLKIRRPLQNAKALIAKGMANQNIPDAG